jgi:hypothetical protein
MSGAGKKEAVSRRNVRNRGKTAENEASGSEIEAG